MTSDPRSPSDLPPVGPGAPTPPIDLAGGAEHARVRFERQAPVPDPVIDRIRRSGVEVSTDLAVRAEASRDWWPGAMLWATQGAVGGLAGVVARPADADGVTDVLRLANAARVPVTAAGGRSGVCGASVPAFGGIVLDTTALAGIVDIDETSMTVDVLPGTFGDHLEADLRARGLTLGHWPQSVALSTVGGWLACRGAGQLSNRYGKIEDMVLGLDVVLADGTKVTTGGPARAAVGPDLNQLFVGSEGTLGIIVGARLRLRHAPAVERRAAYGFPTFAAANDACRRIVQRGLPPAVLRVYDATEADRSYQTGDRAVLLVLDEGDPAVVDASMRIVTEACTEAEVLDEELVERWMAHRNEVSALEALITRGYVLDTMEVTVPWSRLDDVYDAATSALLAVPGAMAASAHQSHAYDSGACLYFTFAGQIDEADGVDPAGARDELYRAFWDAGQSAVLAHGGSLSHHHGVGLNRDRFVSDALGGGLDLLQSVKDALDPHGILNPGKLGLSSPFGPTPYPDPSPGPQTTRR